YAITSGALVGSDAFTGSLTRTSGDNVGKYSINQGTLALSSNYSLTYQNDSLTISTKAITVKADAKSKTYGDSDPSLTYSITSGALVGSDAFTGNLTRTSGDNVGKYSINQGTLALSSNYSLTYQNDSLSISTKAITVKADAKSKTYGASDPSLTYAITSGALVGSDAFTGSLARTSGDNVGKYSINQGTLALSSNYSLTYQNDSLTISTKAITVKADAKSKTYGASDPSLTYAITVGSLVGSDAFTGSLSRTSGDNVGKYSINHGTLALSSNYSLTYQNDSLTIQQRLITIKANNAVKSYGTVKTFLSNGSSVSITLGTLVSGHSVTQATVSSSGSIQFASLGQYDIDIANGTIVIKDGSNNIVTPNYNISILKGILTVNGRTISLSVSKNSDSTQITAGDSIPYTVTITNNGVDTVHPGEVISILEQPQAGLTIGSYQSTAGLYNSTIGALTLNSTFAPTQSIQLKIKANVAPDYIAGTISNTVLVRLPSDVTNPGDSISTIITPVRRWIDLTVTKTTDSLSITAGDTITYKIQVTNNGFSTLLNGENVTILEQPAAGLSVLNYSTANGTYNSTNGALTLNSAFAKSNTITLQVKAKVAATYSGTNIKNTVLVRLPTGITLHGDSVAEVSTPVRRWIAISVNKSTDSLSITAGDTITYSIKVKNNGLSALLNGETIKISEQPATGLIIDSYSTSNGTYNPGTGNLILNANFLSGNQIELRVKAHVIAEFTGTSIANTVLVRLPVDVKLHGDSTSTTNTPVKRWIHLTVDKTSDSNTVTAGDSLTYTLAITNNGVSSLVAGEKVTILEQADAGLILGSASSSFGAFNTFNGQLTLSNTFAKGQTILLQIQARITPTYTADSINNHFVVRLPDDVKLHGDSTGSKKVRVRSLINAVLDDYSNIPVDGAKGGILGSVLWNDSVNNAPAIASQSLNISLVNNDGMTGVSIDSTGQVQIPVGTWEGTYNLTYMLCDSSNCDTATIIVRIIRGLQISAAPKCISDVPYVHYKVTPNFTPDSLNPVSIQWLNGDGSPLTIMPVSSGLPLEADVLYAGTKPDLTGNPTSWPGWCFADGVWRPCDDGFLGVRPKAKLVISINPSDTIEISYPPATPNCNALPPAVSSLSLSKRMISAGPFINVGDSLLYEITVNNTGNIDLHQIEVTDNNASWILPSAGIIDTLKFGDSVILKAWHRITMTDMTDHEVANYASATAKDTGNIIIHINSDTVTTPVERTANLSIVKNSETTSRYAGDSIGYTITITNHGASRIDSGEVITVADQPGNGLSIGSMTTPDGNYQPASGALTLNRNWNKNDSILLFVKGRIDSTFTLDTIRNSVSVNLPIDIKRTGDSLAKNAKFVPRPLIGLSKRATAPVLQGDSTYDIGFVIFVKNYGNVELRGIQVLDDLKKTIPAPSTFTVKSAPVASGALTAIGTFNGNSAIRLLDSANSTLSPGTTATISFLINVNPKGVFGPFNNIAFGTAYDTIGGYNTSDTSTAGNNPDPLGTGNPRDSINNEPTEFSFIPVPVIGIAKSVSVPEVNQNGDQVVTYTLYVKNYSVMPLKNVQISDNLMKTFPSPTTFTVIGTIQSGSTIQANNSFNGSTDTTLLVASLSNLAPFASDSISFRIRISPNGKYGPFLNTAFAFGTDSTGTQLASDASTNGINPDPNADSKPKENEPTILLLTEPKIPVKIPTGFSPNGDGLNDYFYIDNPKGYRLYFAVYNRWGNLIFEQEDYDNSWDGGAKKGIVIGDKIPDGTYFYILEFTDEFDVTHRSSKFLTISR
ncbi:MAG: MBG domain-containing protein, partial [Bacteroidia bacterium]